MNVIRERASNGLPIYFSCNPEQPFPALQLAFRGGRRNERGLEGLADFTTTLLASGAGPYPGVEFMQKVEELGAELSAEGGRDAILIQLDLLDIVLQEGLDLLADMVKNPLFEEEEIERERKMRIAGLKQNRSEGEWLAATTLRRTIYGPEHPYGRSVDGTEKSIRKISREDCLRFHRENIRPENGFLVAVGDIDPEQLVAMVDASFESWSGGNLPEEKYERETDHLIPSPERGSIILIDVPDAVHTSIRMGRIGVRRRDPSYAPLRLLNTILGDYFNSRLNMELRERLGYTYEAWSWMEGSIDPGTVGIGTSVRKERVAQTLEAIFGQLEELTREPIAEEELSTAKSYLAGRQALGSETPEQIAGMIATLALHELPDDYFEGIRETTQEVTAEELHALAGTWLDPTTMTIVLAGDADGLAAEVEKFGKVEIVESRNIR